MNHAITETAFASPALPFSSSTAKQYCRVSYKTSVDNVGCSCLSTSAAYAPLYSITAMAISRKKKHLYTKVD